MQKPHVVASFLIPPDEQTSTALHPTIRAVYHPPPSLEPCVLFECVRLFVPCADVGCDPARVEQVSDLVLVIAFLQTSSLRRSGGRVGPHCGDTLTGVSRHLEVIAVRAVHGE
jgi:hypothetical protein